MSATAQPQNEQQLELGDWSVAEMSPINLTGNLRAIDAICQRLEAGGVFDSVWLEKIRGHAQRVIDATEWIETRVPDTNEVKRVLLNDDSESIARYWGQGQWRDEFSDVLPIGVRVMAWRDLI